MIRKEIWDVRYNALKDFYNEFGNLDIKDSDKRYVEDIDLYQWMKEIRQKYRKNLLTEDEIRLFNDINFPWDTARSMSWEERYQIAKKYYDEHDTVDLPQNFILDDGYKLGVWVQQQKIDFRNGNVSPERLPLLLDLEFDKFAINKKEAKWEKHLALAKKYHSIHGTINVEKDTVFEGFKMGNWVRNVVCDYHEGILPEYRIKQMEDLGIAWVRMGNEEYIWEKNYTQLKTFLMDHSIDELTIESNSCIYNWLDKQKKLIENDNLCEDKIAKLQELNISLKRYTKKDENWDRLYALAKEYYEKHGHLIIDKYYRTENDEGLGSFIQGKRNAYQGDSRWKITQEQIDLLNQIGMVWGSLPEARWNYNLKILNDYMQNTENPFPIYDDVIHKDVELGKFMLDIQNKIKNNELSKNQLQEVLCILPEIETIEVLDRKAELKEKANALMNIGFSKNEEYLIDYLSIVHRNWVEYFRCFEQFIDEKHTLPLNKHDLDNYKDGLSAWIIENINKYKRNVLKVYQVKYLDSLDIDLQRLFPIKKDINWLANYDLFINLLDSEDAISILKNYPDLDNWYLKNAKDYQKNKLNAFTLKKFKMLMDKIDKC